MPASRWVGTVLVCVGLACGLYAIAPRLLGRSTGGPPPFEVPADNPMTDAKVRLGRHLFYDRRLSFNQTIACADCHRQETAFADPRPNSVGATGELSSRNSMSLTNVAYNARYTWVNSRLKTLEQQAVVPLMQEHPLEMGLSRDEAAVMRRFETNPQYAQMFAAAFPSESAPVTLATVAKAIASFERTLISLNSSYDRFVAGDRMALSASAQRGLQLFRSDRMKCSRCHDGFNFRMTDDHRNGAEHVAYHNIGLYAVLAIANQPMERSNPQDAMDASLDEGRFKAPTLRNVSVTAPYMHDGSVATLGEVIDIYAAGGRVITSGPRAGDGRNNPYKSPLITGFTISPDEKRDLLAFLDSLTDRSFLTNPELGNPFATR